MLPSLPQQDPAPGVRHAALMRAKAAYRFAHLYRSEDRPRGCACVAEVPPVEDFSPPYLLQVVKVTALLLANQTAIDYGALLLSPTLQQAGLADPQPTLGDWLGITRAFGLRHQFFLQPFKAASRVARSFPPNLNRYGEVFPLLPRPLVVDKLNDPGSWDKLFAWQRVAGANPFVLQGIRVIPAPGEAPEGAGVLPANFPVTNRHYQSVMGAHDSLERAAAERRLYLADYAVCDEVEQGTWTSQQLGIEYPKYLGAPMALFAWRPSTDDVLGELVPVAIQCHQRPTSVRPNPIFTPADGARWKMACATVQCADATHHEMVSHLGGAHMVMEAIYVTARRTLAATHPLMVLIAQHCEYTLAVNAFAVRSLISPGGQVEALFGATLAGSLTIMGRGLNQRRLDRMAPPDELADRMVDDLTGLPDYPYRDDATLLWPPWHRWIDGYVRLYYGNAEDVALDAELKHFLTLLADKDGGNVAGVPPVDDVAALAKLMATIAWIGSAHHSAVNYAQYPFMSYAPNTPLSLFAQAPNEFTPDNDLNWERMLAPAADAVMQVDVTYQLASVTWRRMGDYAHGAFADARVRPLLQRLRTAFDTVEAQIKDRDRGRWLPYPFLLPSRAQNSIFI